MNTSSIDISLNNDDWTNIQLPIKQLFEQILKAIRIQSQNIQQLDDKYLQIHDSNKSLQLQMQSINEQLHFILHPNFHDGLKSYIDMKLQQEMQTIK